MGAGSYRVAPGEALPEIISPKVAANVLRISRSSIYRLLASGRLNGTRLSPGKIGIRLVSVLRHLEATRKPGYWKAAQKVRNQVNSSRRQPKTPTTATTARKVLCAGTVTAAEDGIAFLQGQVWEWLNLSQGRGGLPEGGLKWPSLCLNTWPRPTLRRQRQPISPQSRRNPARGKNRPTR